MARNTTVENYTTFVRGLITEAEALTFPKDASIDELNCVPTFKGNRRRRLGIDYEDNYALSSITFNETDLDSHAITTEVWESVGGNGNLNFAVIQINDTLYFHDLVDNTISDNAKSFTVSLSSFLASGLSDVGTEPIQVSSGKGLLFVTSPKIDPFYIEYDASGDSISTTEITVEIRDFEGVLDGLDVDENPSSLSALHEYNLKNQGWVTPNGIATDLITQYNTSLSSYPANNEIWWVGKDASDNFDPTLLSKQDFGNTPSPKGKFILNAFRKDRSTVSGVGGISVETDTYRPQTTDFFAGRVWYAGVQGATSGTNLYFSQIIFDNYDNIGYCYQSADPTSENDSVLADNDGGVISIPDAGNIKKIFSLDRFLIVFADNGVWTVVGGDNGFTAADYEILKVSKVNCLSARSVVSVEGIPVWWSDQGIYTLEVNEVSKSLVAKQLTEQTIQTFYDDNITATAKVNVQGEYDRASKRIIWLYKETDAGTNLKKYDRALILNTRTGAFYPWKFSNTTPYPAAIFNTTSLNIIENVEDVTDSGVTVTDSGVDVTDTITTIGGTNTFLKYLTIVPNGSSSKYTFSELNNRRFVDWYTYDTTGSDFESYVITGYELNQDIMRDKQAVYITTVCNKTEDVWKLSGDGDYVLQNPSSCFMQTRWSWADSTASGKFGTTQQIYRFRQNVVPDVGNLTFDNGFKVVVAKSKVRGFGRALSIKFSSESGKDFDLLGWAVMFSGETRP